MDPHYFFADPVGFLDADPDPALKKLRFDYVKKLSTEEGEMIDSD